MKQQRKAIIRITCSGYEDHAVGLFKRLESWLKYAGMGGDAHMMFSNDEKRENAIDLGNVGHDIPFTEENLEIEFIPEIKTKGNGNQYCDEKCDWQARAIDTSAGMECRLFGRPLEHGGTVKSYCRDKSCKMVYGG